MEAQGFRLKFGPGSGVSPEHPDYDASIGNRRKLEEWKRKYGDGGNTSFGSVSLRLEPGSAVGTAHWPAPPGEVFTPDLNMPPNWKPQLLQRIFAAQAFAGSAVGTVDPDSVASLGPLWEDILVEEASRDQLTEEDEAARTPAAAALGHSLPGSAVGKKERKIDRKKNFWWRVVCKILKWREFQTRFYVASRYLNSGPDGVQLERLASA